MKRISVVIAALVVALAAPAGAVDLSVDNSSDKQISKERSLNIKNSIENKLSNTRSKSHDSSSASSERKTRNTGRDASGTLSVPMIALLPDLGLRYRLPIDLGLAPEISRGGWINTTEQEYINKAWASNAPISQVGDQRAIELYIDQIARTGLIAAQAQIHLLDRIGQLAGKKAVDKNGKKNLDASSVIGIDDLPPLAAQAWLDAQRDVSSPYLTGIWDRIQAERKSHPCRLYGQKGVSCGNLMVQLDEPPMMQVGNIQVFGNSFAGLSGDLKVSATSSLSAAFDRSKSITDSVRNATDNLEAKGDSFEAAMARKQALNKSSGSKTNMSPGKFIPGVQ